MTGRHGGLLTQSFNGKPQASLCEFAYAFGSPLNDIHACGSPLNDISACGSPLNDWTLVVGGPSGGVDTGKWRYKVPRLLCLAFVLRIALHIGNRLADPILRIQKDFPLMC